MSHTASSVSGIRQSFDVAGAGNWTHAVLVATADDVYGCSVGVAASVFCPM
jgi:hypothetical protein